VAIKADELRLFGELRNRSAGGARVYVRELVRELGMNENRAAAICEKWTGRGLYDYGVNVLAGWLTEKGRREGLPLQPPIPTATAAPESE
jgi:hypothetical protein